MQTYNEIKRCFELGYGLFMPGGIELWLSDLAELDTPKTILQEILQHIRDEVVSEPIKIGDTCIAAEAPTHESYQHMCNGIIYTRL